MHHSQYLLRHTVFSYSPDFFSSMTKNFLTLWTVSNSVQMLQFMSCVVECTAYSHICSAKIGEWRPFRLLWPSTIRRTGLSGDGWTYLPNPFSQARKMLMFIHQQQLQYQQAHVTRVSVNRSSRQNEERWKLLSADIHAEHCHITVPVSSPIAFAPSRDHCAVNTDAWYKFSSSLNTRDGDGAKYIFFFHHFLKFLKESLGVGSCCSHCTCGFCVSWI